MTTKLCNGCKQTKLFADFPKDKNKKNGLKPRCKLCMKAYRLANREHLQAYHKAWAATNPDRRREISRQWSRDNRASLDAWGKANSEKVKETKTRWKKNNIAAVNADTAYRRAVRDQATPAWANKAEMRKAYDAAQFLGMVTGEWHHVDHIVPLRSWLVCGLHCEANLRVITEKENLHKSNIHWPDMP
jgi:hypothetical protein